VPSIEIQPATACPDEDSPAVDRSPLGLQILIEIVDVVDLIAAQNALDAEHIADEVVVAFTVLAQVVIVEAAVTLHGAPSNST